MQGEQLLKQIEETSLRDVYGFEQVAALGRAAKRLGQHVDNLFDDAVKAADKTHKGILKVRNLAKSRFEAAEASSKARLAEAWLINGWKADGATFSEPMGFEVIDATAIPREFLAPDMKKLRDLVSALGMEAEKSIPGIRVHKNVQVAFRTANE